MGCSRLNSITFSADSQLIEIGREAFSLTSLKTIEFPPSLEIIEPVTFKPCNLLKKAIFPKRSNLKTCAFDAFDERMTLDVFIPYYKRLSFQRFNINCEYS